MRVLVCGDRNWSDRQKIVDRLRLLPPNTLIIQGGARGADRLARNVAVEVGFLFEEFPAEWEVYGRAAGPIRNLQMLDTRPDLVIAFHSNLSSSKGTKHTVVNARLRGIPTEVVE